MQAYNGTKQIYCSLYVREHATKSYTKLVNRKASKTEIRRNLVGGERVSVTLRIPDTLRDVAKKEASLRSMSFSTFVCTCIIEELSKKGK